MATFKSNIDILHTIISFCNKNYNLIQWESCFRICEESIGDRKILGHVLDHIKDCASNDVAAARSNPEATIQ